jgi:tetratricopeptide (TPR) repeat protein
MMERSVETAYDAGQLYRCLQEIDALSRTGQATGKSLSYAATTHMYLGHYNEAVHALEQALRTDDLWVRAVHSASCLQLGNLYDLLGDRSNAEQAYQRTLTDPDLWTGTAHSTHVLAKRYLKRAFTEQDLQATLRPTSEESRRRRQRYH